MFRLWNWWKSLDPDVGRQQGAAKDTRPADSCPIDQTQDEDVFIVGYPKSGNTWFQNLLVGVVYGIDTRYVPDTLVQEIVPDVHAKKVYKRWGTPMFFKSHHLPRPEYRRVVYLLRDGRDAMVSYYHHINALRGGHFEIQEMFQGSETLFPCKWHEHVTGWRQNPYQAEVLTIKYESLKEDAVAQLERFCRFVDVPRDRDYLTNVVANGSFERMRDKEVQMGWSNPSWPKDRPFVRRGKVGSYKDEMPVSVLDAFLAEAAPALTQSGYAV